MYDEFERAMTGRTPKKGLSPFGWFMATAGLLLTVGIVGAGVVGYRVVHRLDAMKGQFRAASGLVAGNLASRLAQAPKLVSMDPEQGAAMLANLDGNDFQGDFVKRFLGRDFRWPDGSAHPDAPSASDNADVSADGGSVHIRSDDGDVNIRLRSATNGGSLSIDSDNGHVRFDLQGGDNGGQLHISSDDGDVNIVLGDGAASEPRWVDDLGRIPSRAQPVISLEAEDAALGAVAWKGADDPGELLTRYQGALEKQGYEVRVKERFRQSGVEHAALWARDEAHQRMVFVVAHRERGQTGVLVGYGEKR